LTGAGQTPGTRAILEREKKKHEESSYFKRGATEWKKEQEPLEVKYSS